MLTHTQNKKKHTHTQTHTKKTRSDANDQSYEVCERLIQAGAHVDIPDAAACTPLHYAASGGHAFLVALRMYGSDATTADAMGYAAQIMQCNRTM